MSAEAAEVLFMFCFTQALPCNEGNPGDIDPAFHFHLLLLYVEAGGW